MRRPPVLDQRRAGVTPGAAIDLLDIGPTAATGGDRVALLPRVIGQDPDDMLRALDAAEGAAELGEHPGPTTEMTGQTPPSVLYDIREPGWPPAEWTDAEVPPTLGQVLADRREQRLEGRSHPDGGHHRHDFAGKAGCLFEGIGADPPNVRQRVCGPSHPASQASAKR